MKREPRLFLVFRATPSLPLCLEFLLNHPSPPQLFCCAQKSLGICFLQHSSSTGSCELRAKKRPHMGADDRYVPCQYFSAEHAASCTIFSASHLVTGAASFSMGRHQCAQSSQHLRFSPCLPCWGWCRRPCQLSTFGSSAFVARSLGDSTSTNSTCFVSILRKSNGSYHNFFVPDQRVRRNKPGLTQTKLKVLRCIVFSFCLVCPSLHKASTHIDQQTCCLPVAAIFLCRYIVAGEALQPKANFILNWIGRLAVSAWHPRIRGTGYCLCFLRSKLSGGLFADYRPSGDGHVCHAAWRSICLVFANHEFTTHMVFHAENDDQPSKIFGVLIVKRDLLLTLKGCTPNSNR